MKQVNEGDKTSPLLSFENAGGKMKMGEEEMEVKVGVEEFETEEEEIAQEMDMIKETASPGHFFCPPQNTPPSRKGSRMELKRVLEGLELAEDVENVLGILWGEGINLSSLKKGEIFEEDLRLWIFCGMVVAVVDIL